MLLSQGEELEGESGDLLISYQIGTLSPSEYHEQFAYPRPLVVFLIGQCYQDFI